MIGSYLKMLQQLAFGKEDALVHGQTSPLLVTAMATTQAEPGTKLVIEVEAITELISRLRGQGYEVIGPTRRDGAIVYDSVQKVEDLPAGWTDEQAPGKYRLKNNEDGALFGYTLGAQGWKRFLHPPEVKLFRVENDSDGFRIVESASAQPPPKYAFLGVRACELAAIALQDRVLTADWYADPVYAGRRRNLFIVAVQCTRASANCFCTSMGTGPQVKTGCDILLTEIAGDGRRFLVAAAGTRAGAGVLADIGAKKAPAEAVKQADRAVEGAAAMITKRLEVSGVRELLYEQFESARWDDVARRCLTCGNCTMVCPTCFCVTVDDASDFSGQSAERWRRWDSCFTQSFSYIHGGSVRLSPKSRYRQWLTHKLAAWQDQFGSPGCVGCGRCITWCPAGIDITEEVAAIRDGAQAAAARE